MIDPADVSDPSATTPSRDATKFEYMTLAGKPIAP
jgi:hypothetical protein